MMVGEGVLTPEEVQKLYGHVDIHTTKAHYINIEKITNKKVATREEQFFDSLVGENSVESVS